MEKGKWKETVVVLKHSLSRIIFNSDIQSMVCCDVQNGYSQLLGLEL